VPILDEKTDIIENINIQSVQSLDSWTVWIKTNVVANVFKITIIKAMKIFSSVVEFPHVPG
jgi:hypothetical protein